MYESGHPNDPHNYERRDAARYRNDPVVAFNERRRPEEGYRFIRMYVGPWAAHRSAWVALSRIWEHCVKCDRWRRADSSCCWLCLGCPHCCTCNQDLDEAVTAMPRS